VINRNPATPEPLTKAGLTLHPLLTSNDLAAYADHPNAG
jgi:orotate phosphoribosyltransferase